MRRSLLAALIVALVACMVPAGSARAAWREAQTTNFVIYADLDEDEVSRLAQRLERYHAAMELVTNVDMPPPSPSNRVTIYILGNWSEMRELAGSQTIAGFYMPRAGRAAAFVPAQRSGRREDFSLNVLLHEYAHHFMISNSPFALPAWYSEGGAEFFGSTRFNEDGGLTLGLPAANRYDEIFYARNVTAADLLDPPPVEGTGPRPYTNFYGKSWLLFHMLQIDPEWRGKVGAYIRALTTGQSARQAAESALGDLSALERSLDDYKTRPRLTSMRFTASQLEVGPVTIRPLTAGEAAMMRYRVVSVRGVNREQATELLARIRGVAGQYPQDAAVQDWLAEAEYDAGNDAEAIAAAERALAIDPGRVNAYVQKGYALFRQAKEAEEGPAAVAAYRAAAAPFLALNGLENDHPLALYYFYLSFVQSGRTPGPAARAGLEHAVELAPFDWSLRLAAVNMHLTAGEFPEARRALMPIAFYAHGGSLATAARTVVERIDAGALSAESGAELRDLLDAGMARAESEPEGGDAAGEGEGEGGEAGEAGGEAEA